MTKVSTVDMMLVDDLFQGDAAGYVLDFSNSTLARFFAHELGVDIYNDAYAKNGTSKANRLRCYLQTADAKAAAQALKALWEYREALHQRFDQPDKVPNSRARLFDLVRKLEGGQPAAATPAQKPRANKTLLEELGRELLRITALAPQPRGFAFEKFLKELFDAYGMSARGSFRVVGEQIDGSFVLSDQPTCLKRAGRMHKRMPPICAPSTPKQKIKRTGRAGFLLARAVSRSPGWLLSEEGSG